MDTCFIASLVSDGGNTGGFSSPSVPQASTIGYTLVIVKLILWIQCSTEGCDTNQALEVDTQALSGDHMWSRGWGVSVPHKKYISARSTPESLCCTLEKPLQSRLAPLPAPPRPRQGRGPRSRQSPGEGLQGSLPGHPPPLLLLGCVSPSPRCCSGRRLQAEWFPCAANGLVILRVVHKPPSRASSPLILTRALGSQN